MKKTRFGIIVGTVSLMVTSTFACIVLSNKKDFKLTGFADAPYSCDLPTVDYVEIQDVIEAIYDYGSTAAHENTYKFRGTVSKRFGDYAFLQRKNQTTYKVDAIRIDGLNSLEDDIIEGSVIDVIGGYYYIDYGTPNIHLVDGAYNIAYAHNPYGCEPLVYEGVTDYFQNGLEDYSGLDSRLAFERYIKLNNVKLWEPLDAGNTDIGAYSYQVGSVYEYNNLSDEMLWAIATDDGDIKNSILERLNNAITTNKLINIRGIAYYHDDQFYIYMNSAEDVEVTDISLIDSSVVSSRTSTLFTWMAGGVGVDMPTFFLNGYEDVPFLEVSESLVIINYIVGFEYPYYWTRERDAVDHNIYRYYRGDQGYYEVDVANDTFTIHKDTIEFGSPDSYSNGYRIISDGGEPAYCHIDTENSIHHAGYNTDVIYDLGRDNIPIIKDKYERIYVPMTVMADILSNYIGYGWVYNGNNMYLMAAMGNDLYNEFYSSSPWNDQTVRSNSMCQYTYNALCFSLRYFYGLADIRGVTDPDTLLSSLNIKEGILSSDPLEHEAAIMKFAGEWLYEGHAGLTAVSPFTKENYEPTMRSIYSNYQSNNARYLQLTDTHSELQSRREAAGYGVGLRTYEDTAIITFDGFKKIYDDDSANYIDNLDSYSYEYLESIDTPLMFRKAFNEIETNNADSNNTKITNVIFDIAMNGGGRVNALPWLAAYVSDTPSLAIRYRVDGSIEEIYYDVDINYNNVFDEANDSYEEEFNFYCLTSNYSFSCGNNFPTYLKAKGLATLIGENSGGGLCVVGSMATASGTIFRNSSNMHLGAWDDTNGVYVGYEYGVSVDLSLDREYFYNDVELYNLIHSI